MQRISLHRIEPGNEASKNYFPNIVIVWCYYVILKDLRRLMKLRDEGL